MKEQMQQHTSIREALAALTDEALARASVDELQFQLGQVRAERSAIRERERMVRDLPDRIKLVRQQAQSCRDEAERCAKLPDMTGYTKAHQSDAARLDETAELLEKELVSLRAGAS